MGYIEGGEPRQVGELGRQHVEVWAVGEHQGRQAAHRCEQVLAITKGGAKEPRLQPTAPAEVEGGERRPPPKELLRALVEVDGEGE